MPRKRPQITLDQPVQPREGDLEKLFATEGDAEQAAGLQLLAIRLDAIVPDKAQPRRTLSKAGLKELSESIRQDGVIQPVEVTEVAPGKYKLVHGERRWRAAALAGLETIPAVVRRRDYDTMTRFVRQLVENIQREDLNDVDRAAGLLHLQELMQAELDARTDGNDEASGASPWARTITWAKVGKRLGYSRQRIHQLIRLLDLPEEIKQDVRDGKLSERETRIYQGLPPRRQSELHRARIKEDLTAVELKQVADHLKDEPAKTVSQAIREVRNPLPTPETEQPLDLSFESAAVSGAEAPSSQTPGQTGPSAIDRLSFVRGHLARIQPQNLDPAERKELMRLLQLIRKDVTSLLASLGEKGKGG